MKILENNDVTNSLFARSKNTKSKCKDLCIALIEKQKLNSKKICQFTIQELINAKSVKNGDVFAIANASLKYDELKTYQQLRLKDLELRKQVAQVIKRINFLDKSSDVTQIVVEFA